MDPLLLIPIARNLLVAAHQRRKELNLDVFPANSACAVALNKTFFSITDPLSPIKVQTLIAEQTPKDKGRTVPGITRLSLLSVQDHLLGPQGEDMTWEGSIEHVNLFLIQNEKGYQCSLGRSIAQQDNGLLACMGLGNRLPQFFLLVDELTARATHWKLEQQLAAPTEPTEPKIRL